MNGLADFILLVIQIQMFGSLYKQEPKLDGTPTKKRKLNDISSFDEEFNFGPSLARKKSIVDCFHFIGAINRKDSANLPMLRKKSMLSNPFDIADLCDPFPLSKFQIPNNNNSQMDIENNDNDNMSESSDEPPQDVRLKKRVTMVTMRRKQAMPGLFRCNSGIDVDEILRETQDAKYGDNIYIQQLNSLKRVKTVREKSTKEPKKQNNSKHGNQYNRNHNHYKSYNDSEDESEQDRLLTDYQVSKNLHAYQKNHENYICLNKLERIFYYVKKINFSDQYSQEEAFELCQHQIRMYNRDDDGHMVRFYQTWEEEDSVYLVFQIATTSLQEKLQIGLKMRENQVWNLLMDCCETLNWMKQSQEWHLNIKPGNLLKCRDKFKLADPLVNSQITEKALNMFKGDLEEQEKLRMAFRYSAPELIEFRSFMQGLQFEKCDIFSLGLCLLENISGISANILKMDLKAIRNQSDKYLRGYSITLRNLILRMVSLDPSKRPTAGEISGMRNFSFFQLKANGKAGELLKAKRKLSI